MLVVSRSSVLRFVRITSTLPFVALTSTLPFVALASTLAGCRGCSESSEHAGKPTTSSASGKRVRPATSASSGASGAAEEGLAIEQFCAESYGKLVAKEAAACSAEERATDEFKQRAQIGALGEAVCAEWLAKAKETKRIRYRGSKALLCARAVAAGSSRHAYDTQLAECNGAIIGTVTLDRSCAHDLECTQGLHCLGAVERQGTTPGTDGACAKPATLGQPCGKQEVHDPVYRPHPTCEPGLYCDERGPTACRSFTAVGRPCTTEDRCADGGACEAGACVAPKLPATERPAGSACDESSQCKGRCVRKPGAKSGVCESFCGSG